MPPVPPARGAGPRFPTAWPRSTTRTDFAGVDHLVTRGWMTEEAGTLSLTEAGEAGRLGARTRTARAHEQTHQGVSTDEYVAALNVLRRMISNLGGDSDLP